MNYSVDFDIEKNHKKLYESLKVEKISRDRSKVDIVPKKDRLSIKITAKDITALRASFDGIIKLIIVFEKMSEVK